MQEVLPDAEAPATKASLLYFVLVPLVFQLNDLDTNTILPFFLGSMNTFTINSSKIRGSSFSCFVSIRLGLRDNFFSLLRVLVLPFINFEVPSKVEFLYDSGFEERSAAGADVK